MTARWLVLAALVALTLAALAARHLITDLLRSMP
jgi:hypothetical protein